MGQALHGCGCEHNSDKMINCINNEDMTLLTLLIFKVKG